MVWIIFLSKKVANSWSKEIGKNLNTVEELGFFVFRFRSIESWVWDIEPIFFHNFNKRLLLPVKTKKNNNENAIIEGA